MHAPRAIELPVPVLINLIQRENAGDLPAILAGGERYVSPRFHHEAERALQAELDRAGVQLDAKFRNTLALIQRPTVEHYGWIYSGAKSFGVLVAARGRTAVTMVRRDDRVSLCHADPDHASRSLVSQLPDVPPARGPSISVRAADFSTSNANAGEYLRQATAARAHEARRLDALLREPRLGGARLYTAARDHTGARRRAKEWLTIVDIAHQGRWLIYTTTGAARAVNAVPATPAMIETKLTNLK